MSLQTSARDEALLEDIASLFDIYASDCDAMVRRGIGKREHTIKARVWRDAAADVRSIKLVEESK